MHINTVSQFNFRMKINQSLHSCSTHVIKHFTLMSKSKQESIIEVVSGKKLANRFVLQPRCIKDRHVFQAGSTSTSSTKSA